MARWNPVDHPRGPGGRFVKKGTGTAAWAAQISGRIGAGRGEHQPVRGRDIRDELDYGAIHRSVGDIGLRRFGVRSLWDDQGDRALEQIYDVQGFHAKPEVVSESELDRRIASGWTEIWRGFGKQNEGLYAELFRTGDRHYPGLGVRGNGTYAAFGPDAMSQASAYTNADSAADWRGVPGLARMAISPDAKIVHANDLDYVDEVRGPVGQSGERLSRGMVLADAGRLAAAMGYDAIEIGRGQGRGSYIILNRSVLAVQEARP